METEKDERAEGLGIAEIAQLADVTPRTVRYYVAEGLLPPPAGAGQQRVYTSEHVVRLRAIKAMKASFLPLAEIRRRLAELSPGDLDRLAESEGSAPPSSALDYLSSLLPATAVRENRPPYPVPPAASPAPRAIAPFSVSAASANPASAPARGLGSAPAAGTGASDESVWRRVTLGPGVEIHYQPSADRRRDDVIAHLIRTAVHLLGGL